MFQCLNKKKHKKRAGVAELDWYLEVTQTGEQTEYRFAPQLKKLRKQLYNPNKIVLHLMRFTLFIIKETFCEIYAHRHLQNLIEVGLLDYTMSSFF